ncbi:MAG: PAS domain-containing methyl-accepting chemotaxis protein [Thalassobaculaceae bacterium]|nr:PAS domain-containing methyl-accepting chemotaxis protein [Thalassobaculaceae bacterium]
MSFNLFGTSRALVDARSRLEAIDRSQAVIEFDLDGKILTANEHFLKTMDYALGEVIGRNHSMFVDDAYRTSAEYRNFWTALKRGEFQSAQFRRIAKNGREVWIRAIYNPILDARGKPYKVVKFATDITEQKHQTIEYEGKVQAIDRSQAVIEFDLDGTILTANENFLKTLGYRLEEIRGRHHSMFVAGTVKQSAEYKQFWETLKSGKFLSGEYRRIRKDGEGVWIQASYNPIFDAQGKPYKVVKFATDITDQKRQSSDYEGQIKAILRSQAVIEFQLDGTILTANENFLETMGYRLDEIQGRHHSIFIDPAEKQSPDYKKFWEALNSGEYHAAEYRRIAKGGREVWIRATYNPIMRPSGALVKVVKFATDVTQDVIARKQAEHIRSLLEETASGAERLSGSVQDIAQSMENSRTVSAEAVKEVTRVDESAKRLDGAAQSMSGILETINDIAEQINLLALNATIEAARAGDAGKGFAVVASEVKNLANQAQGATDEIRSEITNMLSVSSSVVEALEAIRSRIDSVQSLVDASATAVEEQSSVTETMSSNMRRAVEEAANMHR